MIFLQLFLTFFKIGLFGFGGGYGMLSLIEHEVVERGGYLSAAEFTDIVALSQMTPGPIGINSATYVGFAATGSVFGAIVATLAVVLPSFILVWLLCTFFAKIVNNSTFQSVLQGLKIAVLGLILVAVLQMMNAENFVDFTSFAIFFAVLILVKFAKISPLILLPLAGVAGLIFY